MLDAAQGQAEPEIYFRILHAAVDGPNGAPVAAYREQTVEIALGPKGAFENGNIGTLTRQVPADRIINALPPRIRNRKPPKAPRTPRVVELLKKAQEWQALLASGETSSQADIASREGIIRALSHPGHGHAAPCHEIQQQILSMPEMIRRPAVTERALRPIAQLPQTNDQLEPFQKLLTHAGVAELADC